MDTSKHEAIINRYIDAYNAFDISGMLAVLSADIHFENYIGEQLTTVARGIDEFRRLAEAARLTFIEREQRITSLLIDENMATANIVYRGRLAYDVPGGVAGTIIDTQGQSELLFDDDKIVKIIDRC